MESIGEFEGPLLWALRAIPQSVGRSHWNVLYQHAPGRGRFKKIKRHRIPSVTLMFSEFIGMVRGNVAGDRISSS